MRFLARHPWLTRIIAVAVLLAALEGVLRLVETRTHTPGQMDSDPSLLWVPPDRDPREASFTFDQAEEFTGRRALFVGDSSVYGHGVLRTQAFPAQVARFSNGRLQTLNLGAPGYSTEQSLRVLRKVVPREHPDLVVVANLWSDNNFDAFVDKEAFAQRDSKLFTFFFQTNRVLSNSAIWRMLLRGMGQLKPLAVRWGGHVPGGEITTRRVSVGAYTENLETMVELARTNGAEVLFLMLANEEDFAATQQLWPWHPYRRAMRGVAERTGAQLIDLSVEAPLLGMDRETFFSDEMHPSVAGHQAIGQLIAIRLEEWGWLKGGSLRRPPEDRPRRTVRDPLVQLPIGPMSAEDRRYSVAGVLLRPGDFTNEGVPGSARRLRFRVEAVAAQDGTTVLSEVVIPAAAGFVLTLPPQPVRLRLTRGEWQDGSLTWSGPATWLSGSTFDLRERPAWALRIDVEMYDVRLPDPLPDGWLPLLRQAYR